MRERGVKLSQPYHINSDIHEMRQEYDMLKKAADTEAAIKFQRKALVAITSALEWANKRWDPFHLELNGWSEQISENVGDFDNTFERLYHKYAGKAEMPPEAELMLALAGSAFTYHLSHQFFKNAARGPTPAAPPGMAELMQQLGQQPASAQPVQPQPQPVQPQPVPPTRATPARSPSPCNILPYLPCSPTTPDRQSRQTRAGRGYQRQRRFDLQHLQ